MWSSCSRSRAQVGRHRLKFGRFLTTLSRSWLKSAGFGPNASRFGRMGPRESGGDSQTLSARGLCRTPVHTKQSHPPTRSNEGPDSARSGTSGARFCVCRRPLTCSNKSPLGRGTRGRRKRRGQWAGAGRTPRFARTSKRRADRSCSHSCAHRAPQGARARAHRARGMARGKDSRSERDTLVPTHAAGPSLSPIPPGRRSNTHGPGPRLRRQMRWRRHGPRPRPARPRMASACERHRNNLPTTSHAGGTSLQPPNHTRRDEHGGTDAPRLGQRGPNEGVSLLLPRNPLLDISARRKRLQLLVAPNIVLCTTVRLSPGTCHGMSPRHNTGMSPVHQPLPSLSAGGFQQVQSQEHIPSTVTAETQQAGLIRIAGKGRNIS